VLIACGSELESLRAWVTMKSTLATIVGFAFCSLLPLPVRAAEQKAVYKPVRQQVFEHLDKNRDGKLAVDEFLDGSIGRAAGNKQEEFGQLDGDGDGFLSFDEYRKLPKPKRPDPKTEMSKLDGDGDGKLTLEEYLSDKGAKVAGRRTFLRQDTNEDGLVTLDELKRWPNSSELSQAVRFKMRDDDQDGKLTVIEFNLWREDMGKLLAGEADFARHDDDGDGFLTPKEFQFTYVAGGPSPEALFEKLNSNGDSRLTLDEMTDSMSLRESGRVVDTFAEFDTNDDGALDLDEFKARQDELDDRRHARTAPPKWAWWRKLLVAVGCLITGGVALVLLVPWRRIWRPGRLRGVLTPIESLQRRWRWRWGIALTAVGAVCLSLPLVWPTRSQDPETNTTTTTTSTPSTPSTQSPPFPVSPPRTFSTPLTLAPLTTFSPLSFSEPTGFGPRGRSLEIFNSEIRSVAFSDNSRLLAVAEGGYLTAGAVRVWFLDKRKVWASWEEPTGVWSVHISPNGRLVASQNFGDEGRVKIRSVESRKDVLEIDVGKEWVKVRFSPDGKTLATASQGGELNLWNVDDGKEQKSLASLSFRLQCLAFSRDGKRIVAAGGTFEQPRESQSTTPESPVPEPFGWVGVWEIASGNQIAEIKDLPGLVLGVAISPDGKLVATADIDAVARLWEAETGKLVFPLSGHRAALQWVDFSRDGKMLASCAYDRAVKIWNVESGQEVATLSDHDGEVLSTRFSPDGKTLVTAGSEGLVRLWGTQTWRKNDVLHPEWTEGDAPEPVLAIAYAPHRELVASAHGDKTVRLRDPSTGQMVRLLEGNDSHVSSIAFSPDGRVLATADSDKHVKLWDVDRGRELKRLVGHTAEILSVAFSPDGKGLASGGSAKTIRLWDVASGDQRAELQGHSAAVRSVVYSADGKRLASGSDDGAVKIWDPATSQLLATLTEHAGSVQAVAFSPDGKSLATAGEDKSIRLWDVQSAEVRSTLTGHAEMVRCLAFAPHGKTLASGGLDDRIELWDPASGSHRATLHGHHDTVTSLAFAPDTSALVSGSRDKTIRYWKSRPPRFPSIATLKVTDGAGLRFGSISPDGRLMIAAGLDKTISVWDMGTGRLLRSDGYQSGTPICGSLSADGALLATGTYGDTVHYWDVAAGKRVGRLATGERKSLSVDFSPDRARLAVSSEGGTVAVWNVKTRQNVWTSASQSRPVTVVVFSPDGKTLATTTFDRKRPGEPGQVKLWDALNGNELAVLSANALGHTPARFCPDGKLLATGGVEPMLRIWEVKSRQLRSTIATRRPTSCLAFLPDGKWILTGHYGAAISLWDIDSGRLAAEYVDAAESLSAREVWCSPDGSLFVATGATGEVVLWPAQPDESTTVETSAKRVLAWPTEELSLKDTPAALEQELP